MKTIKICFSVIALLAITFVSCRKEMPVLNPPASYYGGDFYAAAFESFWTGMNNNYIFWDVDPTDWDAVYDMYKPKFAQLDIENEEDVVKAYEYFVEMTKDLVDGHFALIVNEEFEEVLAEAGYGTIISPSTNRRKEDGTYRSSATLDKFRLTELRKKYLNNSLRGLTVDQSFSVLQGEVINTAGKNISYFYFNQFVFTGYFEDPNDYENPALTPIGEIFEKFVASLNNPSLDGVIIDLRGNGGGMVPDLSMWATLLTGNEIVAGYDRKKIGNGRLDYGPRVPVTIPLMEGYAPISKPLTVPIVVLADVNSVSCAEISTMLLSHLPTGYFVGESTWGGQGTLIKDTEIPLAIYNAGVFKTNFFEMVYTPHAMTNCINGKNYEGKGFSPKDAPRGFEVKYNEAALTAGTDPQLEKAIEIIVNN
ncbi:MAG: S41 family peptidase [Bacteroidetes bacterium]|nr:S41 family peptidase [Bacteroidota bacterium]